jgi:hypothetical protein
VWIILGQNSGTLGMYLFANLHQRSQIVLLYLVPLISESAQKPHFFASPLYTEHIN